MGQREIIMVPVIFKSTAILNCRYLKIDSLRHYYMNYEYYITITYIVLLYKRL
jgi:hypothetical protein